MLKKIKGWFYYIEFYIKTRNLRKGRKKFKVLNSKKTINKIINNKISVSRFGDGEFRLLTRSGIIGFQDENHELSDRLIEIIKSRSSNHLICIPIFFTNLNYYNLYTKFWCLNFLNDNFNLLIKFLDRKYYYGNADFTRFYLGSSCKIYSKEIVDLTKKIWENQNILIVEGKFSRLGVGNDLFDGAKSIQRILCPEKNAFDKYDEILQTVKNHGKDKLVLLALGPTATVLAFDLAKENIWALDIGHIDLEYMWYLMGATKKTPIVGRLVNETNTQLSLEIPEEHRETYYKSVLTEII